MQSTTSKPEEASLLNEKIGRFRLDEPIGSGSIGTLYRGYHLAFDQTIAVKWVRAETADFIRHYLPTVQILGKLRHPAIHRVRDVLPNHSLIISDWLPHSLVEDAPQFTPVAALRFAARIAEGLTTLHATGLFHHRLHHGNVRLRKEEDEWLPVLSDAGLKPINAEEESAVAPLLANIAPELLQGKNADSRADQYSLGLLLYELLTGTAAFPIQNRRDALFYHPDVELPAIRDRVNDLPLYIDELLTQMTAKNPNERFPSTAILSDALWRVSEGEKPLPPKPKQPLQPINQSTNQPDKLAKSTNKKQPIDQFSLAIEEENLHVQPGEQVETTISMRNYSNRVARYGLDVEGVPSGWLTLSEQYVQLMPGDKSEVTLRFHPPQKTAVHAGQYAFEVNVSSNLNGTQTSVVSGKLQVGAFRQVQSTLHPTHLKNGGSCQLTLRNGGNAPIDYHLQGSDAAQALLFNFHATPQMLMPGQEASVSVQLKPAEKRPILGTPTIHPYTLELHSSDDLLASEHGQLTITPYIPMWVPILLTTALGLGVALFTFWTLLN